MAFIKWIWEELATQHTYFKYSEAHWLLSTIQHVAYRVYFVHIEK